MHSGRGKQDAAHAEFGIRMLQLLERRVGIVHRQNGDAFEAAIAPQVSFGEPVVVSPGRSHGVVAVDDAADALAGGGEEDGIVEPHLIHKLKPPFGTRIFETGRRVSWRRRREEFGSTNIEYGY